MSDDDDGLIDEDPVDWELDNDTDVVKINPYFQALLPFRLDSPTLFDDIGGYEDVKAVCNRFVEGINHAELFDFYGIRPAKSALFNGEPGTGKTLFGQALANEMGILGVRMDIADHIDKYVGRTEKSLGALIKCCAAYSRDVKEKVMIFVDEADDVLVKRGVTNGHKVNDRVTNILLKALSDDLYSQHLVWVFATNFAEEMDKAAMRAGRIDYIVNFRKPNRKECEQIYQTIIKRKEEEIERRVFESTVNYTRLGAESYRRGFVGADIAEVVRRTTESHVLSIIHGDISAHALFIPSSAIEATLDNYERDKGTRDKRKIGFDLGGQDAKDRY